MERTLVLLKPDCVQRRLIGRMIARFEEKGLNLVAMKLMRVTPGIGPPPLCRTRKKELVSATRGLYHRLARCGHDHRRP